jgi:hypothetical protein
MNLDRLNMQVIEHLFVHCADSVPDAFGYRFASTRCVSWVIRALDSLSNCYMFSYSLFLISSIRKLILHKLATVSNGLKLLASAVVMVCQRGC